MTQAREGKVPPARASATICLLRDRPGFEVLMVRRAAASTFMPNAWVFPGGVIDPVDSRATAVRLLPGAPPALQPAMAAALRELVEEVGLWLTDAPVPPPVGGRRPLGADVYAAAMMAGVSFAAERLVHFANWVTPTMLPKRFDTQFFAAPAPEPATPVPDQVEVDRARWVSPAAAQAAATSGEWQVSPPTLRTLDLIEGHRSFDDFAASVRRAGPVVAQRPRLRITGDGIEAVAPGDAGFDELEDLPPDPALLEPLSRIRPPDVANESGPS